MNTTKTLGLLMADPLALACHQGTKTVVRRPGGFARPDGRVVIPDVGTAQVGGLVWIRECWAPRFRVVDPSISCDDHSDHYIEYRADTGNPRPGEWLGDENLGRYDPKWRPSIYMPRWACRTIGRITSVRLERLHDITNDDAKREGFTRGLVAVGMMPHVAEFRGAWNDRYHARGFGWDANPVVARIEWEVIARPEDWPKDPA